MAEISRTGPNVPTEERALRRFEQHIELAMSSTTDR